MKIFSYTAVLATAGWACCTLRAEPVPMPHIVLMMVDDMGIGDTSVYLGRALTPASDRLALTQATPNLDRLASLGAVFTDVHSPSSMCSATRYSLLTGRAAHRSYLKAQGWLPHGPNRPLISPGQGTLGTLMQRAGYHTVCIGKYHVGIDADNGNGEVASSFDFGDVDFSKPLLNGPTHHGFHRFFGLQGNVEDTLDTDPRIYTRDDRWMVDDPGRLRRIGMGQRKGKVIASDDWDPRQIGPRYLAEAVRALDAHGREKNPRPLFLYYVPNANHLLVWSGGSYAVPASIDGKPVAGASRLSDGNPLGPRGDMVLENDLAVGRLLDELARRDDPCRPGAKMIDNTLFIFTSDNGPNEGRRSAPSRESGGLKGSKTQLYEGGHRVPFVACWPGMIAGGGVTNRHFFTLTDLYATFAELLAVPLEPTEASDSYSVLPQLLNAAAAAEKRPRITHHHSGEPEFGRGAIAIRQGNDKLMVHAALPIPHSAKDGGTVRHMALYELARDLGETSNRLAAEPADAAASAKAARMSATLLHLHNRGYSRVPDPDIWQNAGHPLLLDDGEHHLRNDLSGVVGFTFRLDGEQSRRVIELGMWDDHDHDHAPGRDEIEGPDGEGRGLTRHDLDRKTEPGKSGRGLASDHHIVIEELQSDGKRMPLASLRFAKDQPGQLDGEFRYLPLEAPVTLRPGVTYALTMTTAKNDGDLFHHHAAITGTSPLTHPWIEIDRAVFAPAAGAPFAERFPAAAEFTSDYDRHRLPVGPTLRFAAD